jgi:branched-chain amino acid transport system substrate-binding protein
VISTNRPDRRAILTLSVGIALLLSSCLPKTHTAEPSRSSVQALFQTAEERFLAGDRARALEGYERYLEQAPRGDKSRIALSRLADIQMKAKRFDEALPLLERLVQEYPDDPDTPYAFFDMATASYRLGEYEGSLSEAEEWLVRYPTHPLKAEVLVLLGDNQKALGDKPGAFISYRDAWETLEPSHRKQEIEEELIELIQTMDLDALEKIAEEASKTKFAPYVLYRTASLRLKEGRLLAATEAAMALIDSSPEPPWGGLARQLLEKEAGEQSAAKNLIGCLIPLHGPFAIYGQEVLNGIQLGAGFFAGSDGQDQDLELFVRDTRGEPDLAASEVEEMASKHRILAIIGPLSSKSATAAAKKAQELGVPIITLTQKEGITAEGTMVFRNFLTPAREISGLVDRVAGEMGLKRFAILYPGNAYGRYLMNLFWDKVEEYGGIVTAVESYKPAQTDFGAEIKKMVGLYYPRPETTRQVLKAMKYPSYDVGTEVEPDTEEKPEPIVDFDAVFIPDSAEKVVMIAPQFPFHDVFNFRFLGSSLWQSRELTRLAGDYLQGAIFPSAFFSGSDSEEVKRFVERYQTSFRSDPGVLAATGYDTIALLKRLLKSGSVKTRQDLYNALLTTRDFYGVTGHIAFDENREVIKEPVLLTIQGQKIIPLPEQPEGERPSASMSSLSQGSDK